jgi:hypothetical protein
VARNALLGWAFIGLSACTSVIPMSDTQIRKRDALNDATATAQLMQFVKRGICRHAEPVTGPLLAKPEISPDGVISFTAKRQEYQGSSVGGGLVTNTYQWVTARYEADVRTLRDIQIIDAPGTSGCTIAGHSWVIAHPQQGQTFYINVEPSDLDDLVADFAFFTPHLTIKRGAGF